MKKQNYYAKNQGPFVITDVLVKSLFRMSRGQDSISKIQW